MSGLSVSIVTGGGGGMGLAAAKMLGREHHVIISDINQRRLDAAGGELFELGVNFDSLICDVTNFSSVEALFNLARLRGQIVSVVHTAGVSPQMAKADMIMKVNAVGTVHITEAAYANAKNGFALVNVASMAAYMLPDLLIPRRAYHHAFSDLDVFQRKMLFLCRCMPTELYRNGLSYSLSKHFVIWYSKKNAARFGQKNARIVSVSPGSFDTDMGRLEVKSGSAEMIKKAALKRFGRIDEIAELLVFCASSKSSYLTGTDILCDGGVIASGI